MELTTVVQDIHRLGHQLELFERKYNIMSETFYELYCAGQEPEDDDWVLDFAKWAGLYDVWCDRQKIDGEMVNLPREQDPDLSCSCSR